jgi:predicted phage replisome organizer
MANVKWIKLSIEMFDDEKIDFIQSLPEGDSILVIWVRLLVLAGKCNDDGYIYLTEEMPYTEDSLAFKFRKQVNVVRLALETFVRLKMITVDAKGIKLSNWSKHQNLEGLDKLKQREKARLRKQKQRNKEKEIEGPAKEEVGASDGMSRDSHCDVTRDPSYIREREREKKKESKKEDIEREKEERREDMSQLSTDLSLEGCKYYEKAGFGTVSQITLDKISSLVIEFSFEWFKDAIDIAVMRNKKSLSYVNGVLNNWRSEGREEKNEHTSNHKENASSMYDFSMFGG